MNHGNNNKMDSGVKGPALTRRRFLGVAAATAGTPFLSAGAQTLSDEGVLSLRPGQPRSRVVESQSVHVVEDRRVHRTLLTEMIGTTLSTLTGESTPGDAWRSLFRPDDVIGLKFNHSGQAILGTTEMMAEVLIQSLLDAGFQAKRLVCIEAPEKVTRRLGTLMPHRGYSSQETRFSSGADNLALVLDQITALVSIPFLKTHNIAGITASLKNISHGMIKHPARYHANGCSPYIADIVAIPKIRSKLRLCIVDGLRTMYAGGPAATGASISEEGIIIASTDPVACDAVALGVLNRVRSRVGLNPLSSSPADIAYLAAAHRRGLGVAVTHGIDLVRMTG